MVSTRQMSITTTIPSNVTEEALLASSSTITTTAATIAPTTSTISNNNNNNNIVTTNTSTPLSTLNSSGVFTKTHYVVVSPVAIPTTIIPLTPIQQSTTTLAQTSIVLSGSNNLITTTTTTITTTNNNKKNLIKLLDLPVEILDIIFSHVGFKKTAQLRSVSRQMNTVCSAILNSTFQRLQTQLLNRIQTVKAKMPRRESARRNHPLTCEYDIIETCYMRLSLLQMTFGKHIERKHCCFFPGGILDEVFNVLTYIRITAKIARPFRVTDELFDLSTMAMEYFKEYIEPDLPEIGYFVRKDFIDFATNTKPNYLMETKSSSSLSLSRESNSSSVPSPPQSNMVLRKGIRKIKQGMKRYNNQLSVLRSELRTCKRKATEQAKQISDQQKLLAEQQKQTLEYANRLDENDKKNEEMSRKFSTMLQELNKCKTELQYWRSKSPATPMCTSCGQIIAVPLEDIEALVNQGVKPEDMGLNYVEDDFDDDVQKDDDDEIINNIIVIDKLAGPKLSIKNNDLSKIVTTTAIPKMSSKRKIIDEFIGASTLIVTTTSTISSSEINTAPVMALSLTTQQSLTATNIGMITTPTTTTISECNSSENISKKIRRVQNKNRCQNNSNFGHNNNKTRSK